MIIQPKIRNNICITAHPVGCAEEVHRQIEYVKSQGPIKGPKRVLVIGASGGYGLATRIVAAFGSGAGTIGIGYEKPGTETRPGSAGWYNMEAFDREAQAAGLLSRTINGDAFSREIKQETISLIKEEFGQVDLVIYSLAAPVRTDPESGETYRSVLKPIGDVYKAKTVDPIKREISEAEIPPATPEEVAATIKVMGGEDWQLWIEALLDAGVLADNAMTLAYSYIGPEKTRDVYREGTIGMAKEHLEKTAHSLNEKMAAVHGSAYVSVNKALVTRASAVIPVVSLYMILLYKVMKEKGLHEGCIEQMYRLFKDKLYSDGPVPLDEERRIRVDDWEMREDVQKGVDELWEHVSTETLGEVTDIEGFKEEFLRLHGFDVPGVNYEEDVQP